MEGLTVVWDVWVKFGSDIRVAGWTEAEAEAVQVGGPGATSLPTVGGQEWS